MTEIAVRQGIERREEADPDSRLIALWLHGRSVHTQKAYARQANRFLSFLGKPLDQATLGDLQDWSDQLAGDPALKPSSHARMLAAVKSLFSFGHRTGLLPVNVGAALRLPAVRDDLAARILDEGTIHRILARETHPRNHALLLLLYAGALRAEEAASLLWKNLAENGDSGQVTVFGKGGKTRSVLLPERAWSCLIDLRCGAEGDAPVFVSRKGRSRLTVTQVWRIVRKAAERAGVEANVSPHWFRHAHASHAIDRGAPISLVQATLGHASVATTGRYLHARPNDSSGRYLAI